MSHILKNVSKVVHRQKLYTNITEYIVYGLYKSMKQYETTSIFPERHTANVPHHVSVVLRNMTELDRYIFQMSRYDAEDLLVGVSNHITETLGKADVTVRLGDGVPYQPEISVTLDKEYFERA